MPMMSKNIMTRRTTLRNIIQRKNCHKKDRFRFEMHTIKKSSSIIKRKEIQSVTRKKTFDDIASTEVQASIAKTNVLVAQETNKNQRLQYRLSREDTETYTKTTEQ
jgi:hypothetical protein